jgi:hypothetical protein
VARLRAAPLRGGKQQRLNQSTIVISMLHIDRSMQFSALARLRLDAILATLTAEVRAEPFRSDQIIMPAASAPAAE